jgi:hypothetical protein
MATKDGDLALVSLGADCATAYPADEGSREPGASGPVELRLIE